MYKEIHVHMIDSSTEVISSTSLFQEYTSNRISSDHRYKQKTVFVIGYVVEVHQNHVVVFRGDNSHGLVLCYLKDDKIASYIGVNDKVMFRGRCKGFLGSNIAIDECELAQWKCLSNIDRLYSVAVSIAA